MPLRYVIIVSFSGSTKQVLPFTLTIFLCFSLVVDAFIMLFHLVVVFLFIKSHTVCGYTYDNGENGQQVHSNMASRKPPS